MQTAAIAKLIAAKGRGGDTTLMHVGQGELRRLRSLGHITRNPSTGLPEAFNLGHAISQIAKNNPDPLNPSSTAKQDAIVGMITNPTESRIDNVSGSPVAHNVDVASLGPLAAQNPTARAIGRDAGLVAGTYGAGVGAGAAAGAGGTGAVAGTGATTGTVGAGEVGFGADVTSGALGGTGSGLSAGSAAGGVGLTGNQIVQGGSLAAKALGGSGSSGAAPGALSSIIGGGLSLAGADQTLNAYEEAQRKAEAAGQFTPYNVFSGMGSTTFANGAATSTLSPQYQQLRDQYLGNASAGASAAGAFDPNKAASDLYTQMQAEAAPGESQDRANALAQLQAMGQTGLGVGDVVPGSGSAANPLYAALLKAQADAGRQRQISSYSTAQDTANQLQQRALGWAGAGSSLDQQSTAGLAQGANLGAIQTSGALGGAKLAQQPILSQGATKGGVLSGIGNSLLGPGGLGGAVGQIGTGIGNLFTGGTTPSLPAAPPAGNGGGGDTTGAFNNFTGGFGDQSYTGGFYDPNSSSLYNFT